MRRLAGDETMLKDVTVVAGALFVLLLLVAIVVLMNGTEPQILSTLSPMVSP